MWRFLLPALAITAASIVLVAEFQDFDAMSTEVYLLRQRLDATRDETDKLRQAFEELHPRPQPGEAAQVQHDAPPLNDPDMMRTKTLGHDIDKPYQQSPEEELASTWLKQIAVTPPSTISSEPPLAPAPQGHSSAPKLAKPVPPSEQHRKQWFALWDGLIGGHWLERHLGLRHDQSRTCLVGSANRRPQPCAWSGYIPGSGAGS